MNDETLAEALESTWLRWPDRPAVVCGDARLTFGEFGAAAGRIAKAYQSLGIGPGDRIVCSVSNRPEHLISMVAAWLCGAVHTATDYQSTAAELSAIIERTSAKILVWEPVEEPAPLVKVLEDHPGIHVVVVTDGPIVPRCLRWRELLGPAHAQPPPARPAGLDPAIIFFTSGTTGQPKATMAFHGNLTRRWTRLAGWLTFGPDDVHLVQMPLSHGFGLMMAVAGLLAGGRLVLVGDFRPAEVLRLVADQRITVLNGAPAHFTMIVNSPDLRRADVSSLRLSVGTAAAFPPSLVKSIWDGLGVRFMLMYGSSEGVGVATTDPDDVLRGSVGRPEPGSVVVVGPDRRPLPPGEIGELAFSRRTYPVRYWDGGGAASDGWYYSGDLGRFDELGRMYVLGRINHRIDRGGLKVDPVEVENALLDCPEVADAAVLGRPNPVLGETVCACVVPPDGQVVELAVLQARLEGVLAPYKIPEELCVLARIPRTRIGKVDLPRLRESITDTTVRRVARR